MRRWAASVVLASVSAILALGGAEALLRAIDFSFHFAPERVEFGWPDPVTLEQTLVTDPDLFWVHPLYAETLAHVRSEPPDLLFLGDSCTATGSYPAIFVQRLRAAHPGRRIRAENLAVRGWSSYQGLRQMERDVVPLHPRVVTVYFGWNDHWMGFGIEDKEIHAIAFADWHRLQHLRLFQLLTKADLAWRTRGQSRHPNRVAPEDFRHNLREIARLARENGIVPVLLTAPTSHVRGREPEHLADRWIADLSRLVPVHREYASIVREVAREEGVPLCDLAARFDSLPRRAVAERYFKEDGIHLQLAGHVVLAGFLYQCFQTEPALRELWDGPGP